MNVGISSASNVHFDTSTTLTSANAQYKQCIASLNERSHSLVKYISVSDAMIISSVILRL
jgi:hypothetical protein